MVPLLLWLAFPDDLIDEAGVPAPRSVQESDTTVYDDVSASAVWLVVFEVPSWPGEAAPACETQIWVNAQGGVDLALTRSTVACPADYAASLDRLALSWRFEPYTDGGRPKAFKVTLDGHALEAFRAGDPGAPISPRHGYVALSDGGGIPMRTRRPVFPPESHGQTAECQLRFYVDEKGRVDDVVLEPMDSCPDNFAQATVTAGRKWRFYKHRENGEFVATTFVVCFSFR